MIGRWTFANCTRQARVIREILHARDRSSLRQGLDTRGVHARFPRRRWGTWRRVSLRSACMQVETQRSRADSGMSGALLGKPPCASHEGRDRSPHCRHRVAPRRVSRDRHRARCPNPHARPQRAPSLLSSRPVEGLVHVHPPLFLGLRVPRPDQASYLVTARPHNRTRTRGTGRPPFPLLHEVRRLRLLDWSFTDPWMRWYPKAAIGGVKEASTSAKNSSALRLADAVRSDSHRHRLWREP